MNELVDFNLENQTIKLDPINVVDDTAITSTITTIDNKEYEINLGVAQRGINELTASFDIAQNINGNLVEYSDEISQTITY